MIAHNYFMGPFIFKIEIQEHDLNKIAHLCQKSEENNFSNKLVGNFKSEYKINNTSYNEIMQKYFNYFRQAYLKFYGKNCSELFSISAWVNYMSKGDFNPPHVHNYCNFSTVMIIETPDDLKKEIKDYYNFTASEETNGPGCLNFLYGEALANSLAMRSFEPEKGDFFIFPSWLYHWVNPFKCDGERVTVASNLKNV